ncbi:uncharacterized protein tasora isoform X2 [Amphiprion ocellaris]|uniref:uncharacterized protein tasora isoform X2 n=1 Tax=Amphiprion ocellaris TaxID=80972 RepID=UPI00241168EA|nr:uncharacterized protein tasora isoform X2 [Amphiprion ocellaris]
MDDNLARREAGRPLRRVSTAAEPGASASLQDGEVSDATSAREAHPGADRLGPRSAAAAGRMARRNSAPQVVYQRYMPMEPLKLTIPRKTREKRAVFHVSTESREYEDMMTILTASYIDTSSSSWFTYSKPRLVHSEQLEKEFVEKRKEMKADGRTEKELEESYCFLLTDALKLPLLCEKGLFVGQSWITLLGNPTKGVYLSRYSDLLQNNAFTPGATGEIIIFKVMKGKVKSIYENMKNLLDPTPRFDSHISKNASKVTSVTSYRAFELTQQYFYEYSFDELRERPRQVCPYAIVSFQVKGKDSPLPSKPLAPIRLNSQSAEGNKDRAQFTVWSGDLVKDDRVLFQISFRSFSPPFLPHRLPEKLEIRYLMRFDQVTKLLPSDLFSSNLYNSSQEVVNNGHCCSLLEVIDRNRSTTSVTRLLQELEIKRVVLVTPLTEKGFLFLLSSVQMATPTERGESWKRCLQALFVFPETRHLVKSAPRCTSSSHDTSEPSISGATVMPQLAQFVPALHHALVKARANPPAELSAGVERQAREYLVGMSDGTVRQYPMGEYDEQGQLFPVSKHHQVNMDSYLHSYLYSPALYLLSMARAKQMVEVHCGPEQPKEVKPRKSAGGQREATSNTRDGQTNSQKMQQLIDLVLTCKSNAENELRKEVGEGLKVPGRKRKLEKETAERALKFLKASQEPGRHHKIPVEGSQVPSSPVSLTSVIGSVGLKDVDLREDDSELSTRLLGLLTGLTQAAEGTTSQNFCETPGEGQRESSPFDRLATKLGLPTNCDIDLRKQEELEMAGSVSSLEGFSPSSHSGETNHHGAAGRGGGLGKRTGGYEEEGQGEIPWILIPITGLCSERYTQRDRNVPQDPRFQHFATATSITTTTKSRRQSPTSSHVPSPSTSPIHLPSPEASPALSPSQCPSPDPSPPISPSQCPSPEPSPYPSPSQCPSPEPSLPPSPSQCPSPEPSPPPSPSQCWSPKTHPPLSSAWCQALDPDKLSPLIKNQTGANEERLTLIASREFTGQFSDKGEKPLGKEEKNGEPLLSASIRPCNPPALEQRTLPPPAMQGKEEAELETGRVKKAQVELSVKEKKAQPVERVWKQGETEAVECKPNEEEVVDMMQEASSGKEQKGKLKELAGGSVFSPSVSSAAVCPQRDIDSIVDKHVGDFSSEIQLLLQEESIPYSFPQSSHSTSNSEAPTPPHTLPYASVSQFSQYVSFFNPCPPVHDYLSSLRDSISSMLTEFDDRWPNHKPDTSQTNSEATLANRVSAFVASVRAGNAKTGRDDEVSAPCGELNAADTSSSGSQNPVLSRGGEVWQQDAINRNPTTSHVTLSTPTSASASVYKPANTTVLFPPNKSQQSQWKPQQSHILETKTVTQHVQQTQDDSPASTVLCTAGVEGGRTLSGTDCDTTLPGFSSVSLQLAESSSSSEPVSSPSSVSVPGPAPPATTLSSLIGQLQPEVFSNLVKIIKDVKRNSVQFYLHCSEPGDQVYKDVKELLLKQGNVEQTPVAFLNQESSDDRLLVIIKNRDIAGHIHKIPGLVSLKRHSSVVFLGIDTLDDIRNNSYNELFVSGGCIVSDDFVLNPDFITHEQLAALLMFLEKHSSTESVWRWKVHCKTHKRLKEQARFRREAANLLDMLTAYQKRQIVEFLPYHHCDMMNHQSPDLDCLIELQARYTQYRHTVFLTEHHIEKFFAYSSEGIIVSSVEEILHNFTRMVGCHNIKDKQPFIDDLLAPKGHSRQLSHGNSVLGSERSPSIFPEQIHSLSSDHQPQRILPQPGSSLPSHPHLSNQLVPDSSCRDGVQPPSDKDCEVLRQAISQLRAERESQLKQLQHQQHLLELQAELSINPIKSFTGTPTGAGSNPTTPPNERRPDDSVQLAPGRAVAATLDLIHSTLQPELGEERQEAPTEGLRGEAEDRDQRAGNSDTSTLSSNHKATAVTGPSNRTDSANHRRDKGADQRGEPAFSKAAQQRASTCSTTAGSADGSGLSGTHSGQEQPVRADKAPLGNSTTVTGNITMVTDQDQSPVVPQPQPIQRHLSKQQLNLSHPPHSQHRGGRFLHAPLLPRLHSQPFSPGPMLGPLAALGGIRGILGPPPVWSGGLGPTGAAALVWGFQQPGRDFSSPGLLGGYHGPGQGGSRYRGGQRGGGFNGM